jgi:hypothetical protein
MRKEMSLQSDRSRRQKVDAWLAWLCVLVFACLSVVAHVRVEATLIDDAYITYRYASNLAQGRGLVYNPGEWVLGTSTPAYALLLGGAARLTSPALIPAVSKTVNLLLLLAAGAAAGAIGKGITGQRLVGAASFGIVVLGPATLFASVGGMETPLFLALLMAATLTLLRRRRLIAALLMGLTPLVRPEGVFAVGILGAILVVMHLKPGMALFFGAGQAGAPMAERGAEIGFPAGTGAGASRGELVLHVALLLLPGLAWLLISIAIYGSALPHSVVAKRAGVYPLGLVDGVGLVLDHLVGSSLLVGMLPEKGYLMQTSPEAFLLLLLVVLVCLVAGGVWLVKRDVSLAIVPGLWALLALFYATSRTLLFSHYYANFEALRSACWWAGLYALGSRPVRRWTGPAGRERILAALGLATGLLVLLPTLYYYPWQSVWRGQIDREELPQSVLRQAAYRRLAQQVAPRLPANAVVLMPEIGELGFFLDRVTVLDACGLVSPEAVPYLPVPERQRPSPAIGAIPPDLVRDYRPDLIITLEIFGRKGLLEAAWFWEAYTPVIVERGDWLPWDSKALYLFSRSDYEPGLALQGYDPTEP